MTLEEFKIFTKDNWDAEGAKAISENLFLSAQIFINLHRGNSEPDCTPCTDGSIDYCWKTKSARLLINIRNKDGLYEASFYGDHNDDINKIKMTISLFFYKPLYEWIKIFYK